MAPDNRIPSSPLRVTLKVTMDAPSFHPGSVVSATVSLHAKHHTSLQSSRSLQISHAQRPPLSFSASATSSSHGTVPQSGVVRAEYVIAELSGRWNSDRAWVVPDAHPQANPSVHLDNHSETPISASISQTVNSPSVNSTLNPYPWSAALADANAIGGGGRSGHSGIIFRSQPLIVCEDEQIPVESQVSFSVSAVLPESIPPTLRGSSMRYAYALLLVVKFPDEHMPRHLRVPFRVLPIATSSLDRHFFTNRPIPVPTPRDAGPRPNRFLQSDEATALSMSCRLLKSAPPDDIEIALALSMNGRLTDYNADVEHGRFTENMWDPLQRSLSQKMPPPPPHTCSGLLTSLTDDSGFGTVSDGLCVYSVSRGLVHIARLFMSKRVHHLGDSISIMFHFQGDSPCYRIGARLEAQEVVNAEFVFGHDRTVTATTVTTTSAGVGASNAPSDVFSYGLDTSRVDGEGTDFPHDGVVFRRDYGEYGEVVTAARNTEVTFSIPHDAPASFTTGVVTVRWIIQFVFIVPKSKSPAGIPEEDVESKRKRSSHELKCGEMKSNELEKEKAGLLIDKKGNGHDTEEEDDGWRGGPWTGEDPRKWKHLPEKDVDVLRWTLPIVVSGQPGSQWGMRSAVEIVHTVKSHQ